MSAITAKASRKMKKYAVLTREPRCFLGSFDFSWEQRKLASLCEKFTDGDWIESKDQSDFGVRLVQTGNVGVAEYLDKPNNKKWISEDTFDRLHCEEVLPGDILISRLPEPAGRACIVPLLGTKMITAVDCTIVRTAPDMSNKFLVQYLSSQAYFDDVNTCLAGGTRQRISRGNLANFNVPIPVKKSEQDAIGMFFGYLDNLITLHQRKCALLFSPFQAFISMMFTTSTFSWEQRKLSEITDKVTEKNAGLQYVETFTNSAEFGIISQRDFFDHDIAKLGSLDGYYIVKTEDFVYNPRISTSAPVGPINRNKLGRTGVMSPLYTVFRPHDIDTTYLEYFFKCGYWHSFMNFNGDSGARSDRFSIRDNVFFQMPIPIPDIDEQRKIGELLTCLDNLITLHQRKCIFFTGRAGRLISTVNKKRITSSWEQREVGDLLIERSQQAPMSDEYPLMAFIANEGVAPKGERYDRSALVTDTVNKLYKKTEKGDFIYSSNNLETGSIGLNKYGKACISPVYSIFEPTGIADSDFLGRRLVRKDFINAMVKWRQGVIYGQWRIHESDFLKIEISVPSVEEQRKIGAYLDQLDNLITLHQRKPFLMKWRTSDANRNQTNRLVL